MQPSIQLLNVSKQYRLGRRRRFRNNISETLRDSAHDFWRKVRQLYDPHNIFEDEQFWALKDVTLDVAPGEVVGIIGKNGAGKSTLLKMISRITEPTCGEIRIRGRLGSLLEVGTGFHPELTGRENIELNGSILGMSRAEIRRNFDAIVEFSEIAPFLDTPVKRYSSGMYVRLAFAVAAHLDPDILIVDEVLAVGDAAFQKKCLEKMRSVAQDGRTVLVVSHQTEVILRLCHRVVQLDHGEIIRIGSPQEVMAEYLAQTRQGLIPGRVLDLTEAARSGSGEARFTRLSCRASDGGWPRTGSAVIADLTVQADQEVVVDSIAMCLFDRSGNKLMNADSVCHARPIRLRIGENHFRLTVRQLPLNPGHYPVWLYLARRPGQVYDRVESAAELTVVPESADELGPRPNDDGPVACEFDIENLSVCSSDHAGA
jgi:lipopolysaccharide transport system ATP-binding protein